MDIELGDASDVAIVPLPIERWPEFKRPWLDALAREPDAFTARIEDAIAFPDEAWRQRLANPDAVLRFAEHAGRLVGMAGTSFAAHDAPDVAVVFGVYVDSAHRGHGIGRRLIAAVLDDLVDRGTIRTARLGVNGDRQAALALYRSLGFAVVGREERGEPRPLVELTMERPIR